LTNRITIAPPYTSSIPSELRNIAPMGVDGEAGASTKKWYDHDTVVAKFINPLTPSVSIWVAYSYKASCATPG